MICEYQIVKGSEEKIQLFERRVNTFIQDGWEPLGSVTCVQPNDYGGSYYILYRQTMVRRVE